MADDAPADAAGTAVALLGPTSAGSLAALAFYGLYLALHSRYASSELYGRLAARVKVALWVVFAALTVYTGLVVANEVHWMTTSKRSTKDVLDGWSVGAILPVLAAAVQLPVQAILTLRAGALLSPRWARNAFLAGLAILILLSFVAAILSCVLSLLYGRGKIEVLVSLDSTMALAIWLWASTIANIAISCTLGITLRQRVDLERKTTSFIRRAALAGSHTAAYAAVLSFAAAVAISAVRDAGSSLSQVDWAFWLPLPACYGLSLFTTLSDRRPTKLYLSSTATLPTTTTERKDNAAAPVVVPVVEESHPRYAKEHKPRSSAMFEKIETWERRASIDDPRLLVAPALRRASSYGATPQSSKLRPAEAAADGERRRLSTDGGAAPGIRRDSSVVQFR
ncbi:hypothetical protein JCM10207_000732 [Rhodosporidiobolus poonsookiae]